MEDLAFDRPLLRSSGAIFSSALHATGVVGWPSSEDEAAESLVDALNAILQLAAVRPTMSCASFADRVRGAIADHLRSKQGEGALVERRSGLTGWQERRAKQYLIEHVGEDAPITAAAEACKLSYGYFIKAFKATTGQTPHRWLNFYRIELAKELLLGPQSIADIALICGFADQSHLTRVFVRLTGTPPGNWRRQHQEVGEGVAAAA